LGGDNKTNFKDQQKIGKMFPHQKVALPELSGTVHVLQVCPLPLQMHLDLHPLIKTGL